MKKPLHFKSKAAYKRWLAHGRISKVFEKTPGHQKIMIAGKPHKVKHIKEQNNITKRLIKKYSK